MKTVPYTAWLRRMCLLAACAVLAACASTGGPHVRTDSDPNADFGQYQTFGWYEPIAMEQSGYSTWVSERIKANVQREMEARGYRLVTAPQTPDLQINFYGSEQPRTDVYTVPRTDFGWIYNYRARAYVAVPFWYDEPMVSRYTEGTLTLDLVDAKANRMVWSGDAIARVLRKTPEERAADIDAAITAIFAKYPYRAGDRQPLPLEGGTKPKP